MSFYFIDLNKVLSEMKSDKGVRLTEKHSRKEIVRLLVQKKAQIKVAKAGRNTLLVLWIQQEKGGKHD